MSEAICAACGAKGPHGRIRCLNCGQPLMFPTKIEPDRAELLLKIMRSGGMTQKADFKALSITYVLTDRAADELRAVARLKGWTFDETARWVLDSENFATLFARLKTAIVAPGNA